jgi:hypothetical protein
MRWSEAIDHAAQLAVRPSPLGMSSCDALRGRSARRGRASGGRQGRHRCFAELRDKPRAAKDAYWAEQVDIQSQVATAWVLYAEGKHDDALKAMSAAADAEDKTEKHPVTPGVPTPAREPGGTMLLERGMAGGARRIWSYAEEGAQPAGATPERRGGGKIRRSRRQGSITRRSPSRECRSGQAADRAGPRFPAKGAPDGSQRRGRSRPATAVSHSSAAHRAA